MGDQLAIELHAGHVGADNGKSDFAKTADLMRVLALAVVACQGRPAVRPVRACNGHADAGERSVAAGVTQQSHAEGRAVACQRDGNGNAGEIQQIDEIRVGAKLRVGPDRIRFHVRSQ